MMNAAVKQYLKEVNKRINFPYSMKKKILCQLETEMLLFCENHGDADYLTLSDRFGPPEKVAEEYASEMGERAVCHYFNTRKILLFFMLNVVLITISFVAIISMRIYLLRQELPDGQFVASIVHETEVNDSILNLPAKSTIFYDNGSIEPTE